MQRNSLIGNFSSAFWWAWMDVRCKYRRSVIGPFWETINVFVMIMGISYVSSIIFNADSMTNIAYVGLGVIAWSAITAIVMESPGIFMANKEYIRNSILPLDLYVGRMVFRVFIIFSHHFLLYFIGLALLPITFTSESLMVIPGILLLLVNAFWVAPAIGFLCARFRDLEMIIRNLLQLTFFITPIFWNYKNVDMDRFFIVEYNPFFYFLEAIRSPLLGQPLPTNYYIIMLGITVAGYGLLFVVHRAMRRNLAFYV